MVGRNRYRIPEDAAGKVLAFFCSLNGHCDAGQHILVKVRVRVRFRFRVRVRVPHREQEQLRPALAP